MSYDLFCLFVFVFCFLLSFWAQLCGTHLIQIASVDKMKFWVQIFLCDLEHEYFVCSYFIFYGCN